MVSSASRVSCSQWIDRLFKNKVIIISGEAKECEISEEIINIPGLAGILCLTLMRKSVEM